MADKRPLITLLTDFGLQDHFVAVMKGVIFTIQPDAEIIDISHNVAPQNIFQAAFLLRNSYRYFPAFTIHVVVVDPGVGTNRRALVASSEHGVFVAPDNGVLSYLYAEEHISEVREISADHYFLKPRSGTFDGRDVFAPVAAWLAKGVSLSSLGELLTDYRKFEIPRPALIKPGIWRCSVIYVDCFGNLITNLSREQFKECLDASEQRRFVFRIGDHNVSKISTAYVEGNKLEVIALFGSSGFLEFSVNQGNAAKLTGLGMGKDILLKVV